MVPSYSQFTTSRNLLYSYLHIKPPSGSEGNYILFLHGFPSSSGDWHHQIKYFSKKGYGIVAPDLLGYGGTAKPLDVESYKIKAMAQDISEILQHEKISKAIGVAHDWGSYLLSRLANFHPSLFTKYVFVDIGYTPPGFGLSLQTVNYVNAQVKSAMGYEVFGYFLFFQESDAAKLLDQHSESARSLFYSKDEALGKKYMGGVGGFREWLTEGKVAEPVPFFTAEDKACYEKSFSEGYAAPINWYKAALADINGPDEQTILEEHRTLKQPTLLLSSDNFITAAADFPSQMRASAPNLTTAHIAAGHWIQLEKPLEVNKKLDAFFKA